MSAVRTLKGGEELGLYQFGPIVYRYEAASRTVGVEVIMVRRPIGSRRALFLPNMGAYQGEQVRPKSPTPNPRLLGTPRHFAGTPTIIGISKHPYLAP